MSKKRNPIELRDFEIKQYFLDLRKEIREVGKLLDSPNISFNGINEAMDGIIRHVTYPASMGNERRQEMLGKTAFALSEMAVTLKEVRRRAIFLSKKLTSKETIEMNKNVWR